MKKTIIISSTIIVSLIIITLTLVFLDIDRTPFCNAPHILIGKECCIDFNDNKICDNDEKTDLSDIAASINGEIITLDELTKVYNRLPSQTRDVVTKEDLLEQMINEKILLMEAKRQAITVSDDEIETFLDNLITQSEVSEEEFNQRLVSQGITQEETKDEIKKQLTITKLYEKEIRSEEHTSELQSH